MRGKHIFLCKNLLLYTIYNPSGVLEIIISQFSSSLKIMSKILFLNLNLTVLCTKPNKPKKMLFWENFNKFTILGLVWGEITFLTASGHKISNVLTSCLQLEKCKTKVYFIYLGQYGGSNVSRGFDNVDAFFMKSDSR